MRARAINPRFITGQMRHGPRGAAEFAETVERLTAFKADSDPELVAKRLEELRSASQGSANLLGPMRSALKDRCTLGEVSGVLRDEFGEYSEA